MDISSAEVNSPSGCSTQRRREGAEGCPNASRSRSPRSFSEHSTSLETFARPCPRRCERHALVRDRVRDAPWHQATCHVQRAGERVRRVALTTWLSSSTWCRSTRASLTVTPRPRRFPSTAPVSPLRRCRPACSRQPRRRASKRCRARLSLRTMPTRRPTSAHARTAGTRASRTGSSPTAPAPASVRTLTRPAA
eukprot:scaffold55004_cov44-Phaeocystis_antarctica.AAC.2